MKSVYDLNERGEGAVVEASRFELVFRISNSDIRYTHGWEGYEKMKTVKSKHFALHACIKCNYVYFYTHVAS